MNIDDKYQEIREQEEGKLKEMIKTSHVPKKLTRNNLNHFSEFDELTLDITNDKLNKNERKIFKKLPTVKSYEVKTIGTILEKIDLRQLIFKGYEMSLRFQILKIDLLTVMNKVYY